MPSIRERTSLSSHTNELSNEVDGASLTQLTVVATTILEQAIDLLQNVLTSDDQLTRQSKHLPGSTIGKHLRHARDHFMLLLDSVATPAPHVFSYDTRSRNTPMESHLLTARDALKETIARLEEVVRKADINTPMTLHAVTPTSQRLETSFGRELWFAALHAVHHWSMVRVIAGEMDIELAAEFGYAPSTLLHRSLQEKAKI